MTIARSVLELVGATPMVKAQRLATGRCELYLKLESANPGGSIKDRIGLSMIEGAERAGKIKPGATLVEGTAGNTGLGLALVAQQKGYRLILVVIIRVFVLAKLALARLDRRFARSWNGRRDIPRAHTRRQTNATRRARQYKRRR